jgi:hypothetical protein
MDYSEEIDDLPKGLEDCTDLEEMLETPLNQG